MTATMMPAPLTPVQARVMCEFHGFVAEHGYAPSLRELADRSGRGLSTIAYQVRQLEEKGWLRRHPNRPRSLVAVASGNAS